MTLAEQVEQFERERIQQAFDQDQARGRIARITKSLGVHRETLRRKCRELGIKDGPRRMPQRKPAGRESNERIQQLLAASERLSRTGE